MQEVCGQAHGPRDARIDALHCQPAVGSAHQQCRSISPTRHPDRDNPGLHAEDGARPMPGLNFFEFRYLSLDDRLG
ncbi:MAG: hypothetical protein ACLP0B_24430, partial [Steroidobacteraceae bacterium]